MIFKVNNSDITDGLLSFVKNDLVFNYPTNAELFNTPLDMIFGPQVAHYSCLGSYDNPPTWLEITFGNRYIIPSYYSMQGRISQYDGYYLRTWILEGKTQNGKWIKLDAQENNPFSYGSFKTFPIGINIPIKSLKINMTGTDSYGKWWICMRHFDIYGCLISTREYLRTCKQNCKHHHSFFVFIILLLVK